MNLPLLVAARKPAAALAAGYTALVTPAGLTPLTTAVLVRCFVEAGLLAAAVGFLPTTRDADISEVFVKAASNIAPGSPFEAGTTMGPLIWNQP